MTGQRSSKSQVYEIRLQGHLDSCRAQMFEGMQMVQRPAGETVLTGPLLDQAALHGVLNRIRDLGLPLVAVRQVAENEGDQEG